MQYSVILFNTLLYSAIPCNTLQYHAIPCNTMQYYAIQCNARLYHAIPCIINNCWRSVPLPCGQYNGHFYKIIQKAKDFLFIIIKFPVHDGYCCLETFLSLAAEPPARGQIRHWSNNMYKSNLSVSCPTIPPAAGFGLVHKKKCKPNTSNVL